MPRQTAIQRRAARARGRAEKRGATKARVARRKAQIAMRLKAQQTRKKTISVDIQVGGETQVVSVPQSVRGDFAVGTERLVDSTIIHLLVYEIEKQALYVQLTAEGEWRDYTYFNVSLRQYEAFRDAPSKGRHFNRAIRNTQKWGFHHNYSKGKHI